MARLTVLSSTFNGQEPTRPSRKLSQSLTGSSWRRIRKETVGLPAEFRDALALISVSDVETIHANLSKAMSLIEQLQLVNDLFPIKVTNVGK